jgi:hypothetical protein
VSKPLDGFANVEFEFQAIVIRALSL